MKALVILAASVFLPAAHALDDRLVGRWDCKNGRTVMFHSNGKFESSYNGRVVAIGRYDNGKISYDKLTKPMDYAPKEYVAVAGTPHSNSEVAFGTVTCRPSGS